MDSPKVDGLLHPKRGIGVLTSGGDAQGMNAAVRAVVRSAISMGANVYGILNGYQGMVEDKIRQLFWTDVSDILQEGGTFIGTARCAAFMTREGRKQAVYNLLKNGIDRLIVIGGDGSLTGASKLYSEWTELATEIRKEVSEKIQKGEPVEAIMRPEILDKHSKLTIVGLVGSIDNDMPGTDWTIGADTALNRIINAVDSLMSTAASHQREFVVEVMGRNCGWLALMGALATGADWIIIPENPPSNNWQEHMTNTIKKGKQMGRRSSIVIIAEGARDSDGKPISSNDVKEALDKAGFDARITVLGHVQRGGSPSVWDRNNSIIQGVKATEIALSDERTEPVLVGIISNKLTVTPLRECLATVQAINQAIKTKDFAKAMELRGTFFSEAKSIMEILTRVRPSKKRIASVTKKIRIGVLHAGAVSPGMNAAIRAITRLAINNGHTILAITNGFDGLINNEVKEFGWMSVNGWAKEGGARLGVRRVPSKFDFKAVAEAIKRHNIEALAVVGGWDGYEAILHIFRHIEEVPFMKNIPIVMIPASISNNLPCTDYSIGSDTALNTIVECIDKIKSSAVSSKRVFVVEVMGSNGYLALMSALATGAEKVYIPEEELKLTTLQDDIDTFISAFKHSEGHAGLVINNETTSKAFSTQALAALYEDQSKGCFAVRTAVLGHMQQGGVPSGYDRTFAAVLAFKGLRFIETHFGKEGSLVGSVGVVEGQFKSTMMEEWPQLMDMKHRRPKYQWWMSIRDIMKQITFLPSKLSKM